MAQSEPSPLPEESQRIIALVTSGRAQSRAEIAAEMQLAASTVSLRVQELLDLGLLTESGEGPSRGGRRPRLLKFNPGGGMILVADLGGSHARIGLADLTGTIDAASYIAVPVAEGPEAALTALADGFHELVKSSQPAATIRGIGVALPGPVDVVKGTVEMPSRMPGWNKFHVADWLTDRFGVPAFVDNDVNLMALGEHHAYPTTLAHSVTVKASTAIGSGLIASGSLHRGATGAAGDITHSAVPQAAGIPCSCGNTGCLETIASGAALVRQLNAQGVVVGSTADVVALTLDSHPLATTAVRTAGTHLGGVLCTVLNFFNPDAVFLTGSLAELEPFVAAVRSQVYQGCHPLVTEHLVITRGSLGHDAGITGASQLALSHLISDPHLLAGFATS